MKGERIALGCIVACLTVLALEGLWLRALVDDPRLGWLPREQHEALLPWTPPRPPRRAGTWTRLIEALGSTRDAQVRAAARRGVSAVTAVETGYCRLLDPLTPQQRVEVGQPGFDLVDPLYPGLDADSQRVFFRAVSALRIRAGNVNHEPISTSAAPAAMHLAPEGLFWRLGRLALAPGASTLTPEQSAAVLERLRALGSAICAYQALRVELWERCGLPPPSVRVEEGDDLPFPSLSELRRVKRCLQGTASDRPAR